MEVVKVFDKKNTTRRVEIIFAKPEGLDLAIRQGKALSCFSFFILENSSVNVF
jgi:hypothetical protein